MGRRRGGIFLIIIGVVIGLAVGGYTYLTVAAANAVPKIEFITVITAKENIPNREFVTASKVEQKQFPKESVPEGAIQRVDQAINKFAQAPIFQGEILLNAKLTAALPPNPQPPTPAGSTPPSPQAESVGTAPFSLDPRMETGKVMMTFPSDTLLATLAVRPGDRVDVLAQVSLNALRGAQAGGVPAAPAAPPAGATGASTTTATGPDAMTVMLFQNVVIHEIGTVVSSVVRPGERVTVPTGGSLILIVSREDALIYKMVKDA
ncbi:MAG: hypothetical protein HY329_04410, partial [Chloroflexi bacterium]|nr:hypothetical protein [Chloroflexota bacterium]